MPSGSNELRNKILARDAEFQEVPERVEAKPQATPQRDVPVAPASEAPQFRYRVLIVEDDASIRESVGVILEGQGFEVLTAADGLDGLRVLSKSLPDVIISDLNMPRMSGFEFLAIVRKRFPHIATIAMSGEYITSYNPSMVLADVFLQKGQFALEDLFQEVGKLLAASPIRSEREKSDMAPVFVPRDSAGYLIITCPSCLRPNRLEAMSLNGGIHETICRSCGLPCKFEINHEIEPLLKPKIAV